MYHTGKNILTALLLTRLLDLSMSHEYCAYAIIKLVISARLMIP